MRTMSEIQEIIDSLNDRQKAAVTAKPGHCLILAGAGSGKTRVLVHRIAYLMAAYQVSPYEILAVTFTNKAASEMRSRIEKLRGMPIHHMWVGTFHGLAHRLLRAHWYEAELPEAFQIIDSDDQLRLVKRIHRAFDLDESAWPAKQSQWFINKNKEQGKRANKINTVDIDYTTQTLVRVYTEYEVICQRAGLVDFTELLIRSYELLVKNDDIKKHYQQRFSHILVDEFQDTNAIQYRWLKAIAGENTAMMAVGDDDQSIYSWRGALVENIQQFSSDFDDVQTIRLEQNYRSTQTILEAANAVIHQNESRLGKTLWTEGDEGEKITLFEAFNEREEAKQVVAEIRQMLRQGYELNDFAILYRSNAQSRVLEEQLLEAQVPYRIYGGFKFFERAEIKDALAYLRLIVNRHDDAAFERVINLPTRGIGQTTLNKLRIHANEQGVSLWYAAQSNVESNTFAKRTENALAGFLELIQSIDTETQSLKLAELIDHVLSRSGLMALFQKDKSEKGLSRVENLKELISATVDFVVSSDEENMSELAAFLSDVVLDTGEQQADDHAASVSLMTLHAAKGLEFPMVFMVGMEEHLFPHQMSLSERDGLEEERRLCYVGMTRAMKKLFMSCAEYRHLHGQGRYHRPSRFITEIPENLIHRVRPKLTVSRAKTTQSDFKPRKSAYRYNDTGMSIGQRVTHPKFGAGVLVDCEGAGSAARVQVRFDNYGTKWLVLSHAKLQV